MRRLALIVAALVVGCGPGAGDTPDEVTLTVTDGFGAKNVLDKPAPDVSGEETVMRLLQRNAKVTTRYGGGFVQAIGDLRGGRQDGRPVDWFFYVNGVLAEKGASATEVRGGDRVWWDRRDWGVTNKVDAVVGSFPEPFVHGLDGERLSTRIECDETVDVACDLVQKQLSDRGLAVGKSLLESGGGSESLRIVVGRWPEVRGDRAVAQLEQGPKVSGVYARVADDGSIDVLDERGRSARRLGGGGGLVAATRWREEPPTWIVTGPDAAGVEAAARAFTARTLRDRFAIAVDGGRPLALPVVAP